MEVGSVSRVRKWGVFGSVLCLCWAAIPAQAEPEVIGRRVLMDGVSVFQLRPTIPAQNRISMVAINPGAEIKIKVVTAPKGSPNGRAPTSQLCRQTPGCLVAVNGGFFDLHTGAPRGGQEPKLLSSILKLGTKPIAGAVRFLFQQGAPITLGDDAFTDGRHPRTLAFGNAEGKMWFAVVDGRQPGYSLGMTLWEAIDFVKQFGATWAINLDGGCSTTLVVEGGVKNHPCLDEQSLGATGERPVGNAVVLVAKPAPVKVVVAITKPTSRVIRASAQAAQQAVAPKLNVAPVKPVVMRPRVSPGSRTAAVLTFLMAITLLALALLQKHRLDKSSAGVSFY